MKLLTEELQTQSQYNQNGQAWLERSGGKNRDCYWEPQAQYLIKLLKKRKATKKIPLVIEAGAGPATDGKRFKELGCDCVSIDYSTTMMGLAQSIDPHSKLACADMQNMPFPLDSFDGFWASASLLHLSNPIHALRELLRITKPDGVGFISIKEGTGTRVNEKSGFFFRDYRDTEFKKILRKLGFRIIRSEKKPGFNQEVWLMYTVKTPSQKVKNKILNLK